jgi:hypothetical protein
MIWHRHPWRHIAIVVVLVACSSLLVGSAGAQTAQLSTVPAGCTPSTSSAGSAPTTSADCYVAVTLTPPTVIDPIGQPHTATFICDALVNSLFGVGGVVGAPTIPPGCYNVRATVQDITTGSAVAMQSATCGPIAGIGAGAMVLDCSGVTSPICPVGTAPAPQPGPTTPCLAPATPRTGFAAGNTATVTINPGANDAYTITFTGYLPTTTSGSCPNGVAAVPTALTESFGVPPTSITLPETPACPFSVTVDKKYVEITGVALATQPPGAVCGERTIRFGRFIVGPACRVAATFSGTVVLKVNATVCPPGATTPVGITGPPPNPPFPTGSTYQCLNGALVVTNIPLAGLPLSFTVTGAGSFTRVRGPLADTVLRRLGLCSGIPGDNTTLAPAGTVVTVCPTGLGPVSIYACLAQPLPNNQPPVCSNPMEFSYRP